MPDFVKTAGRLVAAILLVPFVAAAVLVTTRSAHAQSTIDETANASTTEARELARFVPSLSLLSMLNAQNVEGHVGTSNIIGPPFSTVPRPPFMIPPPPGGISQIPAQPLLQGTPATARTLMMTPAVGLSFELLSPALRSLPLAPRAVAHVDVSAGFPASYVVPSIGAVGPITVVDTGGGVTEGAILGQGGKLTLEVQPLLVTAGGGIAFTTQLSDRTLRIKTTVEYLREEISASGIVQRAVRNAQLTPTLSAFRIITLQTSGSWVYHGLGPGLELELDTGRAGPLVLSLYFSGKAWRFLDNPKRVLVASNEYGEHAEFTFLKNTWAFGGTMGLRFRWAPE